MITFLRRYAAIVTAHCGAAVACVLLNAPAIAGDATAPATAASNTAVPTTTSGESDQDTLQEVVVTAQRRTEDLNKVPISITALSQDTMYNLHLEDFRDLATVVPGLSLTTVAAGEQGLSDVIIRGIASSGNSPTTQFYIDETPIAIRRLDGAGPSGSPWPLIFDLDRVEVLRGPQGTLFGSSAMGGAIRYITPQPSLTDSSGFAKAEFGYTDGGSPRYEEGVAYGAPLVSGTAGFRVSAWFDHEGGWIDSENPYTGQITAHNTNSSDSYVVRPAITWVPTEGLSVTPALFLQHIHTDEPPIYWLTEAGTPSYLPNPNNGRPTSGNFYNDPQPSNDNLSVSSLAIRYDFHGMSFQSDTSYLDRQYGDNNDWTHAGEAIFSGGNPFIPGIGPSFVLPQNDYSFTHAWQQEFRLTSQDPSSRVSWVTGLYYRQAVQGLSQKNIGNLDPITEIEYGAPGPSPQVFGVPYTMMNGQVLNEYTNFATTDISEAVFGDVDFKITSRLKADVGVRVEHSVVDHQSEVTAGPLAGVSYSSIVLPDQVANPVTPRYSLTYQYTDNNMVYATAAKGYRAGGGNSFTAVGNPLCDPSLKALGLTAVPSTFDSDSLWSYEIGAKGSLFDRRLAFQADVYYIDWTNIQTEISLPSCAGAFSGNQGKAVGQGLELQVDAIVAEGLKVMTTVGYTDLYYPDAAYGAPISGVAPILNTAGERLMNQWTAAVDAEYSRSISALWANARSYIRVDYRWQDSPRGPPPNPNIANYDPIFYDYTTISYNVVNIRLGVVHAGLDLSAYLMNATRSNPIVSIDHDTNPDPLYYAGSIPPLTAGLTLLYRF
ncbi:MAG: TonB-dependent receptor [Steroidobacteraceae bacterium]